MKELFYWDKCSHCRAMLAQPDFEEKFADCEKVNIGESTTNLKRFLKYRDTLEGYRPFIEENRIGIPTVVVDGKDVIVVKA